jgi:hypothetical protein
MKPRRALWWVGIAIVLAATVLAYQHPAVMIQLSEQVWACFG